MQRILIIEDDRDINNLLRINLTDMHYAVEQVYDGNEGLTKALSGQFDLIILDLMLPGMNGLEICKRVRTHAIQAPILMLTSRSEELDKVLGLETGADDYLTKPFSIRELMARVKALLRRSAHPVAESDRSTKDIAHGSLHIELKKRLVQVRGERVELTPKEYDLLVHLASNPGITFSRDKLLSSVWGYEFSGYEHTVNSHINRLRNKIERDLSDPEYILTTWGVGYRFMDT